MHSVSHLLSLEVHGQVSDAVEGGQGQHGGVETLQLGGVVQHRGLQTNQDVQDGS